MAFLQDNKRKASGSKPEIESFSKKAKKSSPTPATPAMTLCLTPLLWDGEPTAHCLDGDDPIEYGKYDTGKLVPLVEIGWSLDHLAHIYKPATPYSFEYKRESYFGELGSSYAYWGGVWGNPDPDPIFLIHRQENLPFGDARNQEGQQSIEDDYFNHSGPPFRYITDNDSPFRSFKGVHISMPDLQLRAAATEPEIIAEESDEDSSNFESDSSRLRGFQGSWTNAFIECVRECVKKKKRELGMLEKTIWEVEDQDEEKRLWALKVKLEPIPRSIKFQRDEPEWNPKTKLRKTRLTCYRIHATVLEVYIKPEYVSRLLKEVPSNEKSSSNVEDIQELKDSKNKE